jgi:hypothetical protein
VRLVFADTLPIIVRMPLIEGDIAMWKKILLLAALGILAAALPGSPASAQATRTWVSGVGDDANPCSRTAPCKTFAGAISKTAAGGEIDNIDTGGFGALTITKSITIDGGGGQTGSVLVSGTPGITVNAGANDVVILRRLEFQGVLGNGSGSAGTPGTNGINVVSAAQVVVDDCAIIGFKTSGINVSVGSGGTVVQVRNTIFRNNSVNGVNATASGAGFATVQVVNSSFVGTQSSGTSVQGGVLASTNGYVSVFNSNFNDLAYGAQVTAGGLLNVDSSFFSSVINGIMTATGTSANVSNNSFYNGTAFAGSGSFVTANNNKIGGTQGSSSLTPMTIK